MQKQSANLLLVALTTTDILKSKEKHKTKQKPATNSNSNGYTEFHYAILSIFVSIMLKIVQNKNGLFFMSQAWKLQGLVNFLVLQKHEYVHTSTYIHTAKHKLWISSQVYNKKLNETELHRCQLKAISQLYLLSKICFYYMFTFLCL